MVKKSILAGIAFIVIIAGLFGFNIISLDSIMEVDDPYTVEFITGIGLPDAELLAFGQGTLSPNITCFIKETVSIRYTDGSRADVSQSQFLGGGSGEAPVQLSLQKRFSNKILDQIFVDLKVRCNDKFTSGGDMNGWTIRATPVSYLITTNDRDGRLISFSPIGGAVKTINLLDNQEHIVDSFNFKASDLESRYSSSADEWRAQVTINTIGKFRFDYSSFGGGAGGTVWQLEAKQGDIVNAFFFDVVKITTPSPPPTQTNKNIEITSITNDGQNLMSGGTKVDTSKAGGRQIKVVGKITDWLSSEGNPKIVITKSGSTTTTGIMSFDFFSSGNAIFEFLYILPRDSDEGEYKVIMSLTGRNPISTRSFWVDNENVVVPPPITPPPPPITPPPTPIDFSTNNAKVFLFYEIVFDDGTEKSAILPNPFSVTLDAFDITSGLGLSTGSKNINRLTLTPFFSFDGGTKTCGVITNCNAESLSAFSLVSSSITWEAKILNNINEQSTGTLGSKSNSCIGTGANTECSNTGLKLGSFVLSESVLESIFQASTNNDVTTTIEIRPIGNFQVRDENGQNYIGSVDGAVFNWNVHYTKSSVIDPDDIECEEGSHLKAVSGGGFICVDDITDDPTEPVDLGCGIGIPLIDDLFCPDPDDPIETDPDDGQQVTPNDDPTGNGADPDLCIVLGVNICASADSDDPLLLIGEGDNALIIIGVLAVAVLIVALALRRATN